MDIKVKAKAAGGEIDWEIAGKKPKQSRIPFKKDAGETEVQFKLDDATPLGLRFDSSGPFSDQKEPDSDVVNEDAPCPADGSRSDQTKVLECKDDKLTVLNKNSEECIVRYKLHFRDKHGREHCVDPEFKNGVKT